MKKAPLPLISPKVDLVHSELFVLGSIVVITLLLMWGLSPTRFLKLSNIQSMAFQLPELGLLSLAMMVTMVTGGINLSIISTADLAGIVAAIVMKAVQKPSGDGITLGLILVAILAALAVSAIIGLINGYLIAFAGVSPILVTLGMMTFLNGISILMTKGYVISGFSDTFRYVGNGLFLGLPVPIIIFGLTLLLVAVLLSRTAFGFELYMLGTNPIATQFSGVNNQKVLMKTYLLSGLMCGLAGIVMISRFNSASSDYGSSYLLITILAAVLGGTSVFGGFGKIQGLVLSLIILQFLSSGLNLFQASSYLTRAIWGLVLIIVMVANYYSSSTPSGKKHE
jgi:simple sugar transport system permease protein